MLTDGEALSVIKAIFAHQSGEELPNLEGAPAMAFSFIRAQLDRDTEKWERIRKARSEAGKTGGLRTQQNNRELKQAEANAFLLKHPEANQAVNVNGNVNGNGIEAGKPPKRTRFSPPTLDDVKKYCDERGNGVDAKRFFDYFEAGGWKDSKGNAVRNWKQRVISWERNEEKKESKEAADGTSWLDSAI